MAKVRIWPYVTHPVYRAMEIVSATDDRDQSEIVEAALSEYFVQHYPKAWRAGREHSPVPVSGHERKGGA